MKIFLKLFQVFFRVTVFQASLIVLPLSPHLDSYAEGINPQNEVGAALLTYRIQNSYPSTLQLGTGNMRLSYARILYGPLQVASSFLLGMSSDTPLLPSKSVLSITVGPRYNIPFGEYGILNAFYIGFELGVYCARTGPYSLSGTDYLVPEQTTTALAYNFVVGKRFRVFEKISLKSSFSVNSFRGIDIFNNNLVSSPSFAFVPMAFSILF